MPILRDEIFAESAADGISLFRLRESRFGSTKQDRKKQAKERGNPGLQARSIFYILFQQGERMLTNQKSSTAGTCLIQTLKMGLTSCRIT